ncbi:hypothetical protein, conserved [Plasmodium gonderi]|uniref:Uncharacterized protein n=1 Tax=Plasmodium gonderi TaxID=77519 RepID=A0A1Y1JIU8_PLAGO|nr:hypothetical protein, conserved [Plasmodium gonderi]GAW81127.1 hypothetical protein, conserved [Plasmodium gonderi]
MKRNTSRSGSINLYNNITESLSKLKTIIKYDQQDDVNNGGEMQEKEINEAGCSKPIKDSPQNTTKISFLDKKKIIDDDSSHIEKKEKRMNKTSNKEREMLRRIAKANSLKKIEKNINLLLKSDDEEKSDEEDYDRVHADVTHSTHENMGKDQIDMSLMSSDDLKKEFSFYSLSEKNSLHKFSLQNNDLLDMSGISQISNMSNVSNFTKQLKHKDVAINDSSSSVSSFTFNGNASNFIARELIGEEEHEINPIINMSNDNCVKNYNKIIGGATNDMEKSILNKKKKSDIYIGIDNNSNNSGTYYENSLKSNRSNLGTSRQNTLDESHRTYFGSGDYFDPNSSQTKVAKNTLHIQELLHKKNSELDESLYNQKFSKINYSNNSSWLKNKETSFPENSQKDIYKNYINLNSSNSLGKVILPNNGNDLDLSFSYMNVKLGEDITNEHVKTKKVDEKGKENLHYMPNIDFDNNIFKNYNKEKKLKEDKTCNNNLEKNLFTEDRMMNVHTHDGSSDDVLLKDEKNATHPISEDDVNRKNVNEIYKKINSISLLNDLSLNKLESLNSSIMDMYIKNNQDNKFLDDVILDDSIFIKSSSLHKEEIDLNMNIPHVDIPNDDYKNKFSFPSDLDSADSIFKISLSCNEVILPNHQIGVLKNEHVQNGVHLGSSRCRKKDTNLLDDKQFNGVGEKSTCDEPSGEVPRRRGASNSYSKERCCNKKDGTLDNHLDRSQLDRIDLDRSKLDRIDLDRKQLDRIDLDRSKLDRIDLDRSQLDRIDLDRNQLDRIDLDRSKLDRIDLDRSQLDRIDLDRNQLDRIDLDRSQLDRIDLDRSQMNRIDLDKSQLNRCELSKSKLNRQKTSPLVDKNDLLKNISNPKCSYNNDTESRKAKTSILYKIPQYTSDLEISGRDKFVNIISRSSPNKTDIIKHFPKYETHTYGDKLGTNELENWKTLFFNNKFSDKLKIFRNAPCRNSGLNESSSQNLIDDHLKMEDSLNYINQNNSTKNVVNTYPHVMKMKKEDLMNPLNSSTSVPPHDDKSRNAIQHHNKRSTAMGAIRRKRTISDCEEENTRADMFNSIDEHRNEGNLNHDSRRSELYENSTYDSTKEKCTNITNVDVREKNLFISRSKSKSSKNEWGEIENVECNEEQSERDIVREGQVIPKDMVLLANSKKANEGINGIRGAHEVRSRSRSGSKSKSRSKSRSRSNSQSSGRSSRNNFELPNEGVDKSSKNNSRMKSCISESVNQVGNLISESTSCIEHMNESKINESTFSKRFTNDKGTRRVSNLEISNRREIEGNENKHGSNKSKGNLEDYLVTEMRENKNIEGMNYLSHQTQDNTIKHSNMTSMPDILNFDVDNNSAVFFFDNIHNSSEYDSIPKPLHSSYFTNKRKFSDTINEVTRTGSQMLNEKLVFSKGKTGTGSQTMPIIEMHNFTTPFSMYGKTNNDNNHNENKFERDITLHYTIQRKMSDEGILEKNALLANQSNSWNDLTLNEKEKTLSIDPSGMINQRSNFMNDPVVKEYDYNDKCNNTESIIRNEELQKKTGHVDKNFPLHIFSQPSGTLTYTQNDRKEKNEKGTTKTNIPSEFSNDILETCSTSYTFEKNEKKFEQKCQTEKSDAYIFQGKNKIRDPIYSVKEKMETKYDSIDILDMISGNRNTCKGIAPNNDAEKKEFTKCYDKRDNSFLVHDETNNRMVTSCTDEIGKTFFGSQKGCNIYTEKKFSTTDFISPSIVGCMKDEHIDMKNHHEYTEYDKTNFSKNFNVNMYSRNGANCNDNFIDDRLYNKPSENNKIVDVSREKIVEYVGEANPENSNKWNVYYNRSGDNKCADNHCASTNRFNDREQNYARQSINGRAYTVMEYENYLDNLMEDRNKSNKGNIHDYHYDKDFSLGKREDHSYWSDYNSHLINNEERCGINEYNEGSCLNSIKTQKEAHHKSDVCSGRDMHYRRDKGKDTILNFTEINTRQQENDDDNFQTKQNSLNGKFLYEKLEPSDMLQSHGINNPKEEVTKLNAHLSRDEKEVHSCDIPTREEAAYGSRKDSVLHKVNEKITMSNFSRDRAHSTYVEHQKGRSRCEDQRERGRCEDQRERNTYADEEFSKKQLTQDYANDKSENRDANYSFKLMEKGGNSTRRRNVENNTSNLYQLKEKEGIESAMFQQKYSKNVSRYHEDTSNEQTYHTNKSFQNDNPNFGHFDEIMRKQGYVNSCMEGNNRERHVSNRRLEIRETLHKHESGKLTGEFAGEFAGEVAEELTGKLTGELAEELTGKLTGELTGKLTGVLAEELTGKLTGELTEEMIKEEDAKYIPKCVSDIDYPYSTQDDGTCGERYEEKYNNRYGEEFGKEYLDPCNKPYEEQHDERCEHRYRDGHNPRKQITKKHENDHAHKKYYIEEEENEGKIILTPSNRIEKSKRDKHSMEEKSIPNYLPCHSEFHSANMPNRMYVKSYTSYLDNKGDNIYKGKNTQLLKCEKGNIKTDIIYNYEDSSSLSNNMMGHVKYDFHCSRYDTKKIGNSHKCEHYIDECNANEAVKCHTKYIQKEKHKKKSGDTIANNHFDESRHESNYVDKTQPFQFNEMKGSPNPLHYKVINEHDKKEMCYKIDDNIRKENKKWNCRGAKNELPFRKANTNYENYKVSSEMCNTYDYHTFRHSEGDTLYRCGMPRDDLKNDLTGKGSGGNGSSGRSGRSENYNEVLYELFRENMDSQGNEKNRQVLNKIMDVMMNIQNDLKDVKYKLSKKKERDSGECKMADSALIAEETKNLNLQKINDLSQPKDNHQDYQKLKEDDKRNTVVSNEWIVGEKERAIFAQNEKSKIGETGQAIFSQNEKVIHEEENPPKCKSPRKKELNESLHLILKNLNYEYIKDSTISKSNRLYLFSKFFTSLFHEHNKKTHNFIMFNIYNTEQRRQTHKVSLFLEKDYNNIYNLAYNNLLFYSFDCYKFYKYIKNKFQENYKIYENSTLCLYIYNNYETNLINRLFIEQNNLHKNKFVLNDKRILKTCTKYIVDSFLSLLDKQANIKNVIPFMKKRDYEIDQRNLYFFIAKFNLMDKIISDSHGFECNKKVYEKHYSNVKNFAIFFKYINDASNFYDSFIEPEKPEPHKDEESPVTIPSTNSPSSVTPFTVINAKTDQKHKGDRRSYRLIIVALHKGKSYKYDKAPFHNFIKTRENDMYYYYDNYDSMTFGNGEVILFNLSYAVPFYYIEYNRN